MSARISTERRGADDVRLYVYSEHGLALSFYLTPSSRSLRAYVLVRGVFKSNEAYALGDYESRRALFAILSPISFARPALAVAV